MWLVCWGLDVWCSCWEGGEDGFRMMTDEVGVSRDFHLLVKSVLFPHFLFTFGDER